VNNYIVRYAAQNVVAAKLAASARLRRLRNPPPFETRATVPRPDSRRDTRTQSAHIEDHEASRQATKSRDLEIRAASPFLDPRRYWLKGQSAIWIPDFHEMHGF
jgi:hypothetical protein